MEQNFLKEPLSKESLKEIMKAEGEIRGAALKTDSAFVLKEKGEEGLKAVERRLEELGTPVKYKEIKTMEFYPMGLRILSLLVIKEVFNFDDPKIQEMGQFAPKFSLIIKLFMKYFLSMERTIKEISRMWRSYYTTGKLTVLEYDQKKKTLVLIIEDCNLHPVFCVYLKGFFMTGIEIIVKSPVLGAQETKCFFRGDKKHEFFFQW